MNANLAPMTEMPIAAFTYGRAERELSIEASECAPFQRVYLDACDAGLAIVGKRATHRFVIAEEHRDLEGDVQYWKLTPIDPRCPIAHVLVWND